MEGANDGQVHSTPGVMDGVAYVTGCDEILRAVRLTTVATLQLIRARTPSVAALRRGECVYGTFNNDVLGINLTARSVGWPTTSRTPIPFYSSAASRTTASSSAGATRWFIVCEPYTVEVNGLFRRRRASSHPRRSAGGRVFVGSTTEVLCAGI